MIEEYLDELASMLDLEPAYARRILAETEDHLREATNIERARGISREEAELRATQQFGPVRQIADRFSGRVSARTWLFRSYVYAALLASVVLIAAGIAGELAAGFGFAFGKSYVAGDASGVSYTAARCADFMEYEPAATSCEDAATLHHFSEIWRNADVAIVFGIVALGVHLWMRRRFMRSESRRSLLRRIFWIAAMTGFGLAAPALAIAAGMGGISNHWAGSGLLLMGSVVSAIAFLVFLQPGIRQVREVMRQYAV